MYRWGSWSNAVILVSELGPHHKTEVHYLSGPKTPPWEGYEPRVSQKTILIRAESFKGLAPGTGGQGTTTKLLLVGCTGIPWWAVVRGVGGVVVSCGERRGGSLCSWMYRQLGTEAWHTHTNLASLSMYFPLYNNSSPYSTRSRPTCFGFCPQMGGGGDLPIRSVDRWEDNLSHQIWSSLLNVISININIKVLHDSYCTCDSVTVLYHGIPRPENQWTGISL